MPQIRNVIDELDKHKTKSYNSRPRADIKTFVIHHSAVPSTVGPAQIARYHVNNLDWPGIGYHFLVSADGVIYQGNAVETVSSHAAKVNPRGVGICFLGNFNEEVPPPDQLRAGSHLVAWLMQELGIALEDVKGHKEFMATACPGKKWLREERWKDLLYQEIGKVQEEAT